MMQKIEGGAAVLALALGLAGCEDRPEQGAQGSSTQTQSQTEGSTASSIQQRAEGTLERAADEQKQAAQKQEEVAGAQKSVREAQEELAEKRQQAEQTLSEAQREQQEARGASQEAEQATAEAQRQTAADAEREARETTAKVEERQQTTQAQAEQQLAARADATSAASQRTVTGQVVRADAQELVLRQEGTAEPDLRLRLDPGTAITVDGTQGAADALRPGMEVRASYDASGAEPKAVKVEAQGEQGQGQAQQPAR